MLPKDQNKVYLSDKCQNKYWCSLYIGLAEGYMILYFKRAIFYFLISNPYFDLWTSLIIKSYIIGLKKVVYMALMEYD